MNILPPNLFHIPLRRGARALLLWCGIGLAACARPMLLAQAGDEDASKAAKPPRIAPNAFATPEFAAPYFEAQLRMNTGDLPGALARLELSTKKANCPPEIFAALARIHLVNSAPDKALTVLAAALEKFPKSVPLLLLKGQALRDQTKYDEAIAAEEEALKIQPNRQEALESLSELHLQQLRQVTSEDDLEHQLEGLIGIYQRMLVGRQGSDRMPPLLILSSLNLRRNQPLKAEPYAREAVNLDGRDSRAYMALGGVLEAEKKTTEALHTYTQAMLNEPGNKDVYEKIDGLLGVTKQPDARLKFYSTQAEEFPAIKELQDRAVRLQLQASKWPEAEQRLTLITQNWPDDTQARLTLVRVWLLQGKLDAGIAEAKRMAAHKDEFAPLVTLSLAEALAQKGEMQRGYDLIDGLYQHDKNDESLALGASAMLQKMKKNGLAIATLREFRQRHPESIKALTLQADVLGDEHNFSEAYALLDGLNDKLKTQYGDEIAETRAQLFETQKKWPEAVDILNALLAKHADNPDYHSSLGFALQALGRNAEAEGHYRETIRLAPENPEAYNSLGYFLAQTRQKLDEALALILKAHQMEPTAGHIVDSLGWVYYQQGDFQHALEQLQQAAQLMQKSPDAGEVYEHLGDAYDKLGRHQEARTAWQRALDLNKDSASVREKLAKQ